MHPDTLLRLRCPLDPTRTATLIQDHDTIVCQQCDVVYPVKHGLPVLIADEATLPIGCVSVAALPCQRKRRAPEAG